MSVSEVGVLESPVTSTTVYLIRTTHSGQTRDWVTHKGPVKLGNEV